MSNFGTIEKDKHLLDVKTKCGNINENGLSLFGKKYKEAFNKLNENVNTAIKELTSSTSWKDKASMTIADSTTQGILNIIAKIEKPVDVVMLTIDGHVGELKKAMEYYSTVVDNYNEIYGEYKNIGEPSESSYMEDGVLRTDDYNSAVKKYKSEIASYESKLTSLKEAADTSLEHFSDVERFIQELMSPSGMYEKDAVKPYSSYEYDKSATEPFNQNGKEETDSVGARKLTKEEVEKVKESHHIASDKDVDVYVTTRNINGVDMEIYYVYSDEYNSDQGLKDYGEVCVSELEKMDPKVLKYLKNNGLDLVLLEDAYLSSYNSNGYCGLYWHDQVVQMRYPGEGTEWCYEWYAEGVIHEFGHAVDYQLAGSNGKCVSELKEGELNNTFIYTDISGKKYTWDDLIVEECASLFPCETKAETEKNVQNTRGTPSEYFAEVTKKYFVSEESRAEFKAVAPKTYAAYEYALSQIGK